MGSASLTIPAKPPSPIQQLLDASPLLESPSTRHEGLRQTVRATLRQAGNVHLMLAASAALVDLDGAISADWLLRAEALIVGRDLPAATAILDRLPEIPGKAAIAAQAYMLVGRLAEARMAARSATEAAGSTADKRALEWIDLYAGATLGDVLDGPLGKRWRHGHTAPAGATIVAVFDYKSPDFARNSFNLGDWMQTLAALRHLARFDGLAWTFDDDGLGGIFQQLRQTWAPQDRIAMTGAVHLAVVDRDFPHPLALRFPGRRVWLLANGWYAHKVFGATRAWPAPDTVVPILTSVHVARPDDLTPDRLAWLAEHAPIGARDHATLAILRGAGIPSFHSGCLTMTLSADVSARRGTVLEVEPAEATEGVEQIVHHRPHLRSVDLVRALDETLDALRRYASARAIRTSRLHAAVPARAVGTSVIFDPPRPSDPRFAGLVDLDDAAFMAKADDASRLMREVLATIFRGGQPSDVRRVMAEHAGMGSFASRTSSDIPSAEAGALPASVTVAVAFDERYAAPARTMLASLRRHTGVAIDLVVMARGLSQDFVRDVVAVAEPASLRIVDMAGHLNDVTIKLMDKTTISTMDRLFLPSHLPEVDKIVYLDVDLMVFDDIAELARFDPGPSGIAARFLDSERNIGSAIEKHARLIDAATASALRDWVGAHGSFVRPRFNAGVLVLSLDRMRARATADSAIDLVKRFALHDQDALNLAGFGAVTALPARWNLISGIDLIERPGIIHWVGVRKPWLAGTVPFQAAWRALEAELQQPVNRRYWLRPSSYPKEWAERARLVATWWPKSGRVADIGCGATMALRSFLDPAVEYVPADLKAWTDEVTAIDLDAGEFPSGRFDAVAMLGVLEYLKKPGLALARARRSADALVVSYCHPRSGADPSSRIMRGWINAYTEDRFEELLPRFGWHVAERKTFNDTPAMRQIVYRCQAGERVAPPKLGTVAEAVVREKLTYLRPSKLGRLEAALARIEAPAVEGDCIEIGIALGGSAIVIAAHARAHRRRFAGFDVFGMIPAPSLELDTPDAHKRYRTIASGQSTGIGGGVYYGYRDDLLAEVTAAFARHGVEVGGDQVALVKGLVQETFAASAPTRIALAHIDCDWHDPVAFSLSAVADG